MFSSLCRFIKEPWVGLKNLEKFLGISHEITEENFFFNVTKVNSLCTLNAAEGFKYIFLGFKFSWTYLRAFTVAFKR